MYILCCILMYIVDEGWVGIGTQATEIGSVTEVKVLWDTREIHIDCENCDERGAMA